MYFIIVTVLISHAEGIQYRGLAACYLTSFFFPMVHEETSQEGYK